jgi:hypothetical protein
VLHCCCCPIAVRITESIQLSAPLCTRTKWPYDYCMRIFGTRFPIAVHHLGGKARVSVCGPDTPRPYWASGQCMQVWIDHGICQLSDPWCECLRPPSEWSPREPRRFLWTPLFVEFFSCPCVTAGLTVSIFHWRLCEQREVPLSV